jgi:putative glutamine amidotransferase
MTKVTHIAMHPGTETETVRAIFKRLGVSCEVVTSPRNLKSIKFDGLVLLGGRDISPFFYGEELSYSHAPDDNRDFIEWQLIRRAMNQQLPIFGICRGHQMINVAHGGALYQDIYRQGATVDHPGTHRVKMSGALAMHAATDIVNSLHHQAVRFIPDGFKVLGRSHDGIIESIYKTGVLGVQWHPEILYKYDARWIELFQWFVDGLE